jgi:tripartite-type tricarboxylate transporter receptor subunit TctC
MDAVEDFCRACWRCRLRQSQSEDSMHSVQRSATVLVLAIIGAIILTTVPSAAQTQNWPQRPVRFILPLGAGSGSDIGARLFGDRLSKRWHQPVVIENKPGGDGLLAISTFVGAKDDHVLLFSPSSSFTAHPYLHANLPYKPSDLVPIVRVSNTVIAIVVPASSNIHSLKELFAEVRAHPGKLNWAGVTGALDFAFAGFLKGENLDMTKVPYRNPVEASNDLAEGRVEVYEAALAIVQPQIQRGKTRVLALTNTARAAAAPGIPTAAEAGFPALTLDGLVGLFGPPGMPLDLRERIAKDFQEAAKDPIIPDRFTATGQVLNIGGPTEFGKSIDGQRADLARIAKELNLKPPQ